MNSINDFHEVIHVNKLLTYLASFVLAIGIAACSPTNQPPAHITQTIIQGGLPDFTPIVDEVMPAVVTVFVTVPAKASPGLDNLIPFFFQIVPNDSKPIVPKEPQLPKTVTMQGSGFVITTDGYIITNNHVVDEATKIAVRFSDNREYAARIIGTDERSDIALLKIDGKNFPTVRIGHSSAVKVGQWVLAMGAPYGFEGTVTAGIVSANNRYMRSGELEPYIQVDAAVNHGNSGGVLVNMAGEVIGINSQIWSNSGDFNGLAFAIPIDYAIDVEKQLLATGHVVRGRIGVVIQFVDQKEADAGGLDRPRGAKLASIEGGGPGAAAGLKKDDIVLSVNNSPIAIHSQMPLLISNLKPGSVAVLSVWRNKRAITVKVKVDEMQTTLAQDNKDLRSLPAPKDDEKK